MMDMQDKLDMYFCTVEQTIPNSLLRNSLTILMLHISISLY